MNKLLDEVQGRFGPIKKGKVIETITLVIFFIVVFGLIIYAYLNADAFWRVVLNISLVVATISSVTLYIRKNRQTIVRNPKIPNAQKEHHTYVAKERPDTAPVPIVAERSYGDNVRQPPEPRYFAPLRVREVELSYFARRRIAKRLPELKGRKAIFEARKSVVELLIQLEKRQPTGKVVKRIGSKDRTRDVLEPRSTIYGELLFVLLALFVISLPVLQGLFTLPQWMITLIDPLNELQILPLVLLVFGGILLIWSSLLYFRKWTYWYYWRLVLFDADPSHNAPARLVILDMPFLMPGGTTPSLSMQYARLAKSATFRTKQGQVSSRADKQSFRSILAGILGVSWLIVDTYGSEDVDFNWMGPFRNTELFETQINMLIANNSTDNV